MRLKGETGEETMKVGLNVLYDVLLKINILMSPIVPFLTEHMYQNMRLCLKEKSAFKEQSIHYLRIPEPQEDGQFDVEIERVTAVMRDIIETGRKLRENKKISLKQPIISLTVVNKSQKLFDDLKPYLRYIEDELNVAEIKNEVNVYKYVKLEALPNLPVLGPKFKGDKTFGDLKKAITNLTTEELLKCKEEGSITIGDKTLSKDDLLIKEKFLEENVQAHEVVGGDATIVLLDTRQNEELKIKGFAREIINRVQKLKKRSRLLPEDSVLIFFRFGKDAKYLNTAMDKEYNNIKNSVKKPFILANYTEQRYVIGRDSGLIDEEEYEIFITPPGPVFDAEKMKTDFAEKSELLVNMILSLPPAKQSNQKQFAFKLDDKEYVLEENKHYDYK